jgi:hypothetical protein
MKRDVPPHALGNSQDLAHRAHLPNAIDYRQAIEYPRRATFRFESCFQNRGAIDVAARRGEWFGWMQREVAAAGVKQPGKHRSAREIRQAKPID